MAAGASVAAADAAALVGAGVISDKVSAACAVASCDDPSTAEATGVTAAPAGGSAGKLPPTDTNPYAADDITSLALTVAIAVADAAATSIDLGAANPSTTCTHSPGLHPPQGFELLQRPRSTQECSGRADEAGRVSFSLPGARNSKRLWAGRCGAP